MSFTLLPTHIHLKLTCFKGTPSPAATNSNFPSEPSPLDPKINRGTPWLIGNTCVKYHNYMLKGNRVTIRKQSIAQT